MFAALAGWAQWHARPHGVETLRGMLHVQRARGGAAACTTTWSDGPAALGVSWRPTTPSDDHGTQPCTAPLAGGSLSLVGDVRLDHRADLAGRLGLNAAQHSDLQLLAAAYQRWGSTCCRHLEGDWAFALWDGPAQRLLLARDPLGVRPLCYRLGPEQVVFASDPRAILALPGADQRIDGAFLADAIAGVPSDPTQSAWLDLRHLGAGCQLEVTSRSAVVSAYWKPHDIRIDRRRSPAAWADELRFHLDAAVRSRLSARNRVAVHLSGGLDSSSVAALAARALGDASTLTSISLHFPRQAAADERAWIDRFRTRWPTTPIGFSFARRDPLAHADQLLMACAEPLPIANHVYTWLLAQIAAEQNCPTVLTGHDGDTIVGHHLGWLGELALRGQPALAVQQTQQIARRQHLSRSGLLREGVIAVLWARLRHAVKGTAHAPAWLGPVHPALAQQNRVAARLNHLLRSTGLGHWRSRVQHAAGVAGPLMQTANRFLDQIAAHHGIELRHPFLDKRVVECCLRLPAEASCAHGHTRWVLREAMRGLLPDDLRWRGTKANMAWPLYHELKEYGQASAERLVAAGRARLEPLLQPGSADRLLALLRDLPWYQLGDDNLLSLWHVSWISPWLATQPGQICPQPP